MADDDNDGAVVVDAGSRCVPDMLEALLAPAILLATSRSVDKGTKQRRRETNTFNTSFANCPRFFVVNLAAVQSKAVVCAKQEKEEAESHLHLAQHNAALLSNITIICTTAVSLQARR